jgi:glycosyltransferase involved in cell wall biosynthesis
MSPPANHPLSLSVVIPTYNRPRLLTQTVEALCLQEGVDHHRIEVVVVDDGSIERADVVLAATSTPFDLRIVREPHSGVATARNAGWKEARGEVVIFLDDDVIPARGLVAAHATVHAAHDDAVTLGNIAADPARRREAWNAYEDAIKARKYQGLTQREIPSGIPYGGNFSVRRRHLEAAGGFDQSLVGNHDVDLGFRFQRMGLRFVYEPLASAVHAGGSDLATWTETPRRLGRMDVAMYRDRGYAGGLPSLVACFHDRHPLNRMLAHFALTTRTNERSVVEMTMAAGVATHALGLNRLSRAWISASANVLYWSGVRDGLRGNRQLWELVRGTRHHPGRPYQAGVS